MTNEDMGSNIPEVAVIDENLEAGDALKGDTNPSAGSVLKNPGQKGLSGKRVRIVLEDNAEIPPSGQFLGINGVGYLLRPNEEADVPIELLAILDDARVSLPVKDPATLRVIGYRERARFPYRIVVKRESA